MHRLRCCTSSRCSSGARYFSSVFPRFTLSCNPTTAQSFHCRRTGGGSVISITHSLALQLHDWRAQPYQQHRLVPSEAGDASAETINLNHGHSYDTLVGSSCAGAEQTFELSECYANPSNGLDPSWDLPFDWDAFDQAYLSNTAFFESSATSALNYEGYAWSDWPDAAEGQESDSAGNLDPRSQVPPASSTRENSEQTVRRLEGERWVIF